MKCPHCRRGELVKKYFNTQLQADMYICTVCSRGWHQDKKADGTVTLRQTLKPIAKTVIL